MLQLCDYIPEWWSSGSRYYDTNTRRRQVETAKTQINAWNDFASETQTFYPGEIQNKRNFSTERMIWRVMSRSLILYRVISLILKYSLVQEPKNSSEPIFLSRRSRRFQAYFRPQQVVRLLSKSRPLGAVNLLSNGSADYIGSAMRVLLFDRIASTEKERERERGCLIDTGAFIRQRDFHNACSGARAMLYTCQLARKSITSNDRAQWEW